MVPPEWGPFPELAVALRLHPAEPRSAYLSRLAGAGGVWRHFGRQPRPDFWPSNMPPVDVPDRPRLRGWWGWHEGPPTPVDPAPLETLLPACHAWLAVENARYLAPWLASDPPAPGDPRLFETSNCALAWTLAAAACAQDPDRALGELKVLRDVVPDATALPGDLLALHLNVERFAVSWVGHAAGSSPASPRQRGGGLRRKAVLEAFTTLHGSRRTALEFLACHSPLTWLAYFDVLPEGVPPGIASALPATVEVGTGDSASSTVEAECGGSASWLALVANSLFGALLAGIPNLAEWQETEAERTRLEQVASRGSAWERFFDRRRLSQLQRRCNRLKSLARGRFVNRLDAWRTLATHQASGPLVDLHALVLDRMARTAAVRCSDGMRTDWSRARRTDPNCWANMVVFEPSSAYLDEFSRLLLGTTVDAARALLDDSALAALRDGLDSLLRIAASPKPGEPTRRFLDPDRGVRLPFPPPGHRGPSVADLSGRLLSELHRHLPEPVTAATVEDEEATNVYA